MQPKPLSQIELELGVESTSLPSGYSSIELVVEKTDIHLEYYLPNPYKEVTLLARERGFHIISHDKSYKMRRDFSIPFSTIKQIKLLPSFSLSKRPSISFVYAVCSMAVFTLVGLFVTKQSDIVIWAVIGLVFGCSLSLAYNKSYRSNILLMVDVDSKTENIFFSVGKTQLKQCIAFFITFCDDVFTDERTTGLS